MEITDSQLRHYVDSKLKLPKGARKAYLRQVDVLIDRLRAEVGNDPDIGVVKFHKTGSLRKGTVLRPRGGHGVDADIAVYIDENNTTPEVIDDLHARIRRLLINAYPMKQPSDFTVQPRTLGIVFNDSGLEIDLVPIIPIVGLGDYGWQPSSRGEPLVKTSVPGQLEFIRERKQEYAYFTVLVRLLKHWRNYKEFDGVLRSFTIELIVSHLQDAEESPDTILDGLLRFYLYVAQTELRERIEFGNDGTTILKDRVQIIDPVNGENNVARRMTESDCRDVVAASIEAWELLNAARAEGRQGQTLDYCRQVFGPSFDTEDA